MSKFRTGPTSFDVIVIGAGHAGCEAALAAARRGARVLVLTPNLDRVGYMPCNPSIGGPAKGHLVAEIDALGGEMGRAADRTALQVRRLNTGRGPAVQALRAQCDKSLYALHMKEALEDAPNVAVLQDEATGLLLSREGGAPALAGVACRTTGNHATDAVVVTAGTFLRARVVRGEEASASGRAGERADTALAEALASFGMRTRRFKTGTPPRVDARSVDFARGKRQYGDPDPGWFSRDGRSGRIAPLTLPPIDLLGRELPGTPPGSGCSEARPQLACLRLDTTTAGHDLIRANLHRAPMYNGAIDATGPRYCPSIEDKVARFDDKDSHPVYLEPEGWRTVELYVQGMSTSLPAEVQDAVLRGIPALADVAVTRYGYAVEYDALDPNELSDTLEARQLPGLFFAGQVNGTSGYEEAAAQGLVAGANAAARARALPPLRLGRRDGYTGVMIDDLVSRPFDEPYRMLTSRAEHRLLLRTDTADSRLAAMARDLGLVSAERFDEVVAEEARVADSLDALREAWFHDREDHRSALAEVGIQPATRSQSAHDLLRRPDVRIEQVVAALDAIGSPAPLSDLPPHLASRIDTDAKYAGFIERAEREADRHRDLDGRRIAAGIDFGRIPGLRIEARQQLDRVRPGTVGQASRLAGVTPGDVTALLIHATRQGSTGVKVVIVSDIHANLAALEAVLRDVPSFDRLWNLGDTVGYGPKPRECLDLMVDYGASPALVGNHDLACIGEVDLTEFNPVAQIASRWTALQLGMDHRTYLKELPAKVEEAGYTLAHGSPRAPIWEYVTSPAIATENFDFFETPACFIGHTHLALYATLANGRNVAQLQQFRDGAELDLAAGRHLVNPGSVGQPRDRDPRAAYAILDTERGTVTSRRVDYDIALTQRQMALANLPDVLVARLAHGM